MGDAASTGDLTAPSKRNPIQSANSNSTIKSDGGQSDLKTPTSCVTYRCDDVTVTARLAALGLALGLRTDALM